MSKLFFKVFFIWFFKRIGKVSVSAVHSIAVALPKFHGIYIGYIYAHQFFLLPFAFYVITAWIKQPTIPNENLWKYNMNIFWLGYSRKKKQDWAHTFLKPPWNFSFFYFTSENSRQNQAPPLEIP